MKKEWKILNKNPTGDIITSILKLRNIRDPLHFLQPREEDLLPLTDLAHIEEAAKIVLKAIKENKKIFILGDVDNDGVSANAIIYRYLKFFIDNVTWGINIGKRHGLLKENLQEYVDKYDLIIAVDSSSELFEEQQFLIDNGVQVIVLDHHPCEEKGIAVVVNSQFNHYRNKGLAGAGVTFKFVKYLDFLQGTTYAEEYYDLAASGIIGDMMDVSEGSRENRYICAKGFANLKNPGLKEIIGKYNFDSTSVAFSISPTINAGVRMNRSELAAQLLLEDDKKEVKNIVKELKELKVIQNIQKDVLVNKLNFTIKTNDLEKQKVIGLITEKNTSLAQGDITGLCANVLCDDYSCPVIIVHETDEEGVLQGSVRSEGVANFKDLVKQTKLVIFAKGHDEAFGIQVKKENWASFIAKINERLKGVEFVKTNMADVVLEYKDITVNLIKKLEYVNQISGKGFNAIKVIIRGVEVNDLTFMQHKHLKFSDNDMDFLKWNSSSEFEDFKSRTHGIYKTVDLIGKLQIGKFRGIQTKQMIIDDTSNFKDNLGFLRIR